MMTIMLALAAAAAPSAEAETLGRRLAEAGTLGTLLPMIIKKDTEELVAAHPDLNEADKAELRAVAQEVGKAGMEKALAANGHAFAEALSVEDLKAALTFYGSPSGKRFEAAQPQVIVGTMKALGAMDFKKDVAAAFCAKTRKLCE